MKRLFTAMLSLALVVSVLFACVIGVSAQDTAQGTEEVIPTNAIAISNAWELSMIGNEYPADGYYYLAADIDMCQDVAENGDFYDGGKGWTPVGTKSVPFTGTFNGNGHAVKNMKINRTTDYVGLFGYASGAKIFNLTLEASEVIGGQNTAGVVGYADKSDLYDLEVKDSTIKGTAYVGGVGGSLVNMTGKTIYNCVNGAAVTGTSTTGYVGGVFGEVIGTDSLVDSCQNTGAVSGKRSVGGIAGSCYNMVNCNNRGEITAKYGSDSRGYAGGLAGVATKVQKCFNTGTVSATGYYYSSSSYSYMYTGGIAGRAATIEECYNTGTISAGNSYARVAAIAGGYGNSVTVKNCYSDANKLPLVYYYSSSYVPTTIENSYNLNGTIATSGTATNCYYYNDTESGVGGLRTKRQLRAQITFTDWDFENVWTMAGNEDYRFPELKALPSEFVKSLTSVSLTSVPEKTNYIEGKDVLDISALKLKLYYDNETNEQIDVTADMVSGFDNTVVGTQTVTVTYNGLSDTFQVTVDAKSVVSVALESLPTKLQYLERKEELDLSGAKLHVTYNNDTSELIDLTAGMVSGFDNATVGPQTLTVTVGGQSATFDITITPKSISRIEVATNPAKLNYLEGESLALTGGAITIYYDNDTSEQKDMSECVVSTNVLSGYGQQAIVVSYQGFETSFNVAVDHTYDNACDAACNGCGALRTPSTHKVGSFYTFTNSASYPFSLSNGIYSSTNKGHSSSATATLNIQKACSITIEYYTSTEANCDRLTIKHNNTTKVTASGTTTWTTITIQVAAGDTIQIQYSKDHSVNAGSNEIQFKLNPAPGIIEAENALPTCTEAVVCDVCGVTVKPALGHSYSGNCDASCNTCQATRTAPGNHTYTNACDASCNVCDATRTVPDHVYSNACDGACNICGFTRVPSDHVYTNACDKSCNVCGAIRSVPAHVYDNACDKTCNVCGATRSVPAHVYTNACDATCNVCGVTRSVPAHVYSNACDAICNICGATRSVPAHVYSNVCDTTCNVCGATRTTAGHKVSASNCYTVSNNSYYPFTYSGGIYTSTNKSSYSSSQVILNIQRACTLKIEYYTSTERNYDTLTIAVNSLTKVTASGSTYWTGTTLNVAAGDRVYITYSKDRSVNAGSDEVKFKISGKVSANNISATCTSGVVCTECNQTVKAALGHSYTNACDTSCNRCGATRTIKHTYTNKCDTSCNVCKATRTITHTYTNSCDTSCNVCKATRTIKHTYSHSCDKTCNVCKATRTIKHTYSNNCDKSCNVCGATRTVGAHKYSNACDTTCNYCNAKRTIKHTYSNKCDTSCNICKATRTVTHTYSNSCDTSCNLCKATRKITHTYSNSCDTSCNVCKATRKITHTYSNACDKSCNVCKATRKVGAHKYSNACDKSCNICGATRTVGAHKYGFACDKTCNICNAIRTVTHKYKNVITKATTSKSGSVVKKCSVCGTVASTTAVKYVKTFKLSSTVYVYDGKVKTPSVTVQDANGKTLVKDTDYTVSYASGRKGVGTYKVTITLKGKYSGTKTLTFTVKPTAKASVQLLTGGTSTIGAKSDKTITYTSSNKSVATVSSKGVITAVKAGTATITVKSNGVTQKITVTVKTPYVTVTGTNSVLLKNSVTLKATTNTGATVVWSSSDKSVATVSSTGKVTGQKAGTATIYAKVTYKGKTYTGKFQITVKKPYLKVSSATVDKGKTYTISVVGGSGTITYTSSDKSIATVSSSGVVKGLKKGTCTITVKRNGCSMSFKVTVREDTQKEVLAAYAEFILKNVALKNPSTYRVNNYIYVKTPNGGYNVYVWYSAANGFGGMIDGWAMAQYSDDKSIIAYSVKYGTKFINVYTGWSRPSTFEGYLDADTVREEYRKIGTISYFRPRV